jgi:hypothetical protein
MQRVVGSAAPLTPPRSHLCARTRRAPETHPCSVGIGTKGNAPLACGHLHVLGNRCAGGGGVCEGQRQPAFVQQRRAGPAAPVRSCQAQGSRRAPPASPQPAPHQPAPPPCYPPPAPASYDAVYRVVGSIFVIAVTRAGTNPFVALNLVTSVTRMLCAECKTVDLTPGRILKR